MIALMVDALRCSHDQPPRLIQTVCTVLRRALGVGGRKVVDMLLDQGLPSALAASLLPRHRAAAGSRGAFDLQHRPPQLDAIAVAKQLLGGLLRGPAAGALDVAVGDASVRLRSARTAQACGLRLSAKWERSDEDDAAVSGRGGKRAERDIVEAATLAAWSEMGPTYRPSQSLASVDVESTLPGAGGVNLIHWAVLRMPNAGALLIQPPHRPVQSNPGQQRRAMCLAFEKLVAAGADPDHVADCACTRGASRRALANRLCPRAMTPPTVSHPACSGHPAALRHSAL